MAIQMVQQGLLAHTGTYDQRKRASSPATTPITNTISMTMHTYFLLAFFWYILASSNSSFASSTLLRASLMLSSMLSSFQRCSPPTISPISAIILYILLFFSSNSLISWFFSSCIFWCISTSFISSSLSTTDALYRSSFPLPALGSRSIWVRLTRVVLSLRMVELDARFTNSSMMRLLRSISLAALLHISFILFLAAGSLKSLDSPSISLRISSISTSTNLLCCLMALLMSLQSSLSICFCSQLFLLRRVWILSQQSAKRFLYSPLFFLPRSRPSYNSLIKSTIQYYRNRQPIFKCLYGQSMQQTLKCRQRSLFVTIMDLKLRHI